MKQKLIPIFAWILGFSVGFLGGAFIGLILGGTFLGGFDIYAATGFEGYELSAYAGAIIGGADDTAEAKMKIMAECGIHVVQSPADIGKKMAEVIKK